MGQIELPPLETLSASDGAQEAAAQKLEDATLEPCALVEQTGDIKQAEAIQGSLETLMTSHPNSQAIEGMPPFEMTPAGASEFKQEPSASSRQQAIPVEVLLKPASGSDPGGAGIPPIDLPPQVPGNLDTSNVVSGNMEQAGSRLPRDSATRIGSPSLKIPGEPLSPNESLIGTGKPDTSNIDQTVNLDPGGSSPETGIKRPPLAPLDKNGMSETPLGTSQEGTIQTDNAGLQDLKPNPGSGLEGSDGSEWVPPEMYANTNQDGSISIVGPDGETIESPPLITKVIGPDGKEHYLASYPQEGNGSQNFEISAYSAPLTGMYVHTTQDGSTTVVDANGKPLDSPPIINKAVDPSGKVIYSASYPGTQGLLTDYTASLTGMYVHTAQNGSTTVVDANGKPLDSPPTINKAVDPSGKVIYSASYPGTQGLLTDYTASLTGLYVHTAKNGSTTVVDANGKPLDSPPQINKAVDPSGKVIYAASYPGAKGLLTDYSASLTGLYVHTAQDGSTTVVDATGKPLDSPPIINKTIDHKGKEIYSASYPGSQAILTSYSASLTGVYVHINQDGSASVVDSNGKPLDSPPLIQIISNAKGGNAYLASYPGSQGTALEYYMPPSAKPVPGA
jgi:hypothetical protein